MVPEILMGFVKFQRGSSNSDLKVKELPCFQQILPIVPTGKSVLIAVCRPF